MKVVFHKNFLKDYARLGAQTKESFEKRLELFYANPYDVKLSNHPLKGKWFGYRSINITGDLRAVYKEINDQEVIFIALGSHSHLYG